MNLLASNQEKNRVVRYHAGNDNELLPFPMQLALSQFYDHHLSRFFKREKCLCFHCGESMRKEGALMATFQQVQQPVCCHGCLAVLNTIQSNGLIEAYLQSKQVNESNKL